MAIQLSSNWAYSLEKADRFGNSEREALNRQFPAHPPEVARLSHGLKTLCNQLEAGIKRIRW